MSNGYFSRKLSTLSALTLPLLTLVSCTGGGSNTNSALLGTITNTVNKNTLTVRVVNETTYSLSAEIRVDGQVKILPACSAAQRICEYLLTSCPQVVELIQETRVDDTTDAFMGGRNFEGNPTFTFTPGEFQCGDMIMFQFSEDEASAQVM